MTRNWRDSASCRDMAPKFDVHIDGESEMQQKVRIAGAQRICSGCPVISACEADFVRGVDFGVRFGEVFGLPRNAIVGGGNGRLGQTKKRASTVEVIARVMELTAQGLSATQIGDKLGITGRAVVWHRAEGRYQNEQQVPA